MYAGWAYWVLLEGRVPELTLGVDLSEKSVYSTVYGSRAPDPTPVPTPRK